ncbi:MAG: aminotransferase class I/II-fold pyridoxal phosphate-dependent enzyme [Spirochaetes bacterium]|jgi:glycine C-acetyltransferase|nr:aminotransferase class I/II-fold pyridoxal phosphate-dependent enzyme [Spirochaetota bacterium]
MALINETIKKQSELVTLLKKENIYTYSLEVGSACENHITVNGKECINFISNNYLGFSTHPAVLEAVSTALQKYGLGIGGSPLACGTTEIHYRLMNRIASVYGQESCVLYASGYQAMLGSVQTALGKGDVAVLDALVHRSILDGVILSGCDTRMWLHNDIEDLGSLLDRLKKKYRRMLIMVDSVYSMDGDWANLPELYRLKKEHGALIMIDEAHSLGVLGKTGRGLPEHFDMPNAPDIISGTFSKFAGAIGGFVAGPYEFIDYMKHTASPYVFSASLSPLICAGVLKSFDLLDEEPEWRQRLWENIKFFLSGLAGLGFDTGPSKTAVVPLIIRDTIKTMLFNRKIFEMGVYASPIVHPAVPPAESRIRLGVMATHTREDLEKTLDVFAKVGKDLGII